MGFRISRRIGPLRISAWERAEPVWNADLVLNAYKPNWPKRIAIVAVAFAPAWIAFGLGWGLLFAALAIVAGVALLVAYGRSEAAYETDWRSFVAWCGTITAGIVLAVLIGMLVEVLVKR